MKAPRLNKAYGIVLILLITVSSNIYSQQFRWARDIKSEGFDEGFDLAVDQMGNVFVAGQLEFLTQFGNGIELESVGRHDIFVAKYDSSGDLIWAIRAGGKGGDKVQSIAYDPHGFIFIVGEFEDTAYWDGTMLTTDGPDINNMFIAKYDTSGSMIWVRIIDTSSPLHTRGYGVSVDNAGNVYACGGAEGNVNYHGTHLFNSAGDYDGTIYKFNTNGNLIWAKRFGGTDSDKAYGIVADNNGFIYVTGYFAGTADFSPTVSKTVYGHTDAFLAKYDTAGTLQWVKQAGDTGFDRGWDVTKNINGQILITGECQSHARFGSNYVFTKGNEDMFLAAYNSSGTNMWALSGGGVEDDIGRGVSTDMNGNVFVAGDFGGSAVFHPDSVIGNGFADFFLASYAMDGSALRWIKTSGGTDNDRGRGVGTDPAGNVYICGEYVDNAQLDNIHLTGDSLLDIFVTKISSGTIGISDITASDLFNIYPNPVSNFASIKINVEGVKEVALYDDIGQLCYSDVFIGNEYLLNMNHLSNGIYFLNVVNEHSIIIRKKIIINR